MDDPLVSLQVKRGSGLQTSDVRSVAQLCLCVAAQLPPSTDILFQGGSLLIRTKLLNSGPKHPMMQQGWIDSSIECLGSQVWRVINQAFRNVGFYFGQPLPHVALLFIAGPLHKFSWVLQVVLFCYFD